MPRRLTTAQRGYDHKHRILSERARSQAVGSPCVRCHKVMLPGQPLDLDHTDDRTGYNGVAHASCNRRAGARKATARRRLRANPQGRGMTQW